MGVRGEAGTGRPAGAREAELPAALGALVADVVRRAGLDRRERLEVAAELAAHFRDGLAAGATCEELRADFGDPGQASRLIGRAKRRCRPAAQRARRYALQALAASALLAAPPYAVSAVRLYSAEPARGGGVDTEVAVARDVLRDARRLATEARDVLARGEGSAAAERLIASLDGARALAARRTLPAELARMSVLDEVVTVTELAARDAEVLGSRARRQLASRLRDELARGSLGFRADVIGPALKALLDRVYATPEEGGGPTAHGLRMLQRLKADGEPGLPAVLLEPAYFVAPARRREVAPELDRLRRAAGLEASGAGRGLLDGELARLERDRWSRLRFVPVILLNRRLARAIRTSRRLERDVPRLVAMLEQVNAEGGR